MRISNLILASLAICFTACDMSGPSGSVDSTDKSVRSGGSQASCSSRTYENIGGPISLLNQDGEQVTEADFSDRPSLVYFGFTYCPDICPGTLVAVKNAYETPESLAEYTMDHSSILYLMDKNWKLQTFFSESVWNPESMANCIATHLTD